MVAEYAHATALDATTVMRLLAGLAGFGFMVLVALALFFRRQPIARASGLLPRAAALAGTFSLMALVLFPKVELSGAVAAASFLLIVGGYLTAMYAIRHLGRSLSMMAEARRLVTSGP